MPTDVQIAFSEIDPFVRFVGRVCLQKDIPTPFRLTYDHRFFFVIRGKVQIICNGCEYTLLPDDVFYLPSGTEYCIAPILEDAVLIILNFDFFRQKGAAENSFHFQIPCEFQPERIIETVAFSDTKVFQTPLFLRSMPELRPYLKQMVTEHATGELLYRKQISNLLSIVLTLVFRRAGAPQSTRHAGESYRHILLYIQAHATEDLSNQSLAALFNYHPNYINQLIHAQTGYSLHQYVLRVRVRRATQLLLTTGLSVADISEAVGFRDISYFSQYYKKCTGMSPSAVRSENRQPNG